MKTVVCIVLFVGVSISCACAKVGVGAQGDLFLRSELPASSDFVFKGGAVKPFVGGSLTFASNHSPWVFAVQVKREPWTVGFTADNWFVYKKIAPAVDYFVFWGISGGVELERLRGVSNGPRAGVGVNAFIVHRHLELYAQVVWNPYFGVNLDRGDDDVFFIKPINFPVNAGFRVWF